MKKLNLFLCLVAGFLGMQQLGAQTSAWPKEIPFPKTGGKVIIYQPQPDALNGNILTGRAAIAAKEKSKDELVFGAIFFEAKLFTDMGTRKATLESFKITNAKVTGLEDQTKMASLIGIIEKEVPNWNLNLSVDQLVATIKKDHPDAEIYNNTPPKIIYRDKPTTLVILDGEPKVQQDKNLEAERVVNSPYLIFKEGAQWNMYVGGIWYKSASVTNGWTASTSMSKKVKSINDQIKKQEKENNDNKEVTTKPEVTDIIVSTVPAEVIQTKGAPEYKKIDSTTLQYVSNSNNDIIKTADGQIFILIAGRWFKSSSFNGPWTFNEPDKLPADFSRIPEGSAKDNVLVSVAGTNAAEEAMIDVEIPQTAKVDRKTATVTVEYDGDPKFETIEGTTLQLALNSNLTVLKEASGDYFALDNGVWFVSSKAKGPWKVADKRPAGIDAIPSKSAAYNARFVYIYEATADYVVVGYTGGYLGSYIQGDPVIVFGTGFYYQPWYGAMYYPRPATWGFSFSYNPWTGWSMGIGFNVGFMHVGISFGGGYGYGVGWFGPPYYRPPYRPPYYGGGYYGHGGNNHYGNNNININTGNTINVNNNHNNIYNNSGNNNVNRPGVSGRPNNNNSGSGSNYRPNNSNTKSTAGTTAKPGGANTMGGNTKAPAKKAETPNNVFADKDGNVFQQDSKGNINQRDNKSNSWKPADNSPSKSNIQKDAQSRERSNTRTSNYNNAAKPAAATKPAAKPAASSGTRPPVGKRN